MATYIVIRKIQETKDSAEYGFGKSEDQLGILKINKLTGEVLLVKEAPGINSNSLYEKAAYKIRKHWESGELPENTCWAS
jgi:hypothetical protein